MAKAKSKPKHAKKAAGGKAAKNSAKVTKDYVKKVASVARLNFTEKELDRLAGELEKILESFRELERLDTSKISPSFQPLPMVNTLREDKVRPSLPQDRALKNARNREAGFVKGPRVV